MERVMVVGSGGAGKTTLARRLAEMTGLPLTHVDLHRLHSDAEVDALIVGLDP